MNSRKLFRDYIDGYQLITQHKRAGGDGGDSCHRTMNILSCLKLIGEQHSFDTTPIDDSYDRCLNEFSIDGELYRRHPDITKWYSRPENFSRDQCIMLLWGMITFGDDGAVHQLFDAFFNRKFMNQNTYPNHTNPGDPEYIKKVADPVTPGQLAMLLRGMNVKWHYPIVCLLDLFMLIDIPLNIFDDYKSKKKGKRSDAWTMMAAVALSTKQRFDNPVAWLARKILSFTDYKGAITWIFATPENNDPPIHEIMLPLCEKYIDRNEKL